MSDKIKRTGEKLAGINIQMRFVPESEIKSDKEKIQNTTKTVQIIVRDDDDKKGTADNLRRIDLTQLYMLSSSGETLAANRYKLQTAIFNYKGWNGPEWFEKRMTILNQTLSETAMLNLSVAQKKARKEFLELYLAETTVRERTPQVNDEVTFIKQNDIFLPWLEETRVLFKLGYLDTANPDVDAALQAYHNAINDFERGIFYYVGQMAWKDSTMAYRNHLKYYTNSIVKPFNMSIDDYITRMNEYAELLQYLPPPSKRGDKSRDARWDKIKPLNEDDIREAIYDGLPEPYRSHVSNNFEQDWQDMEESDFLDALRAYEKTDQEKRRFVEASKDKEKKKRADAPKSKGKRTSDDDVNPRSTKRYCDRDG